MRLATATCLMEDTWPSCSPPILSMALPPDSSPELETALYAQTFPSMNAPGHPGEAPAPAGASARTPYYFGTGVDRPDPASVVARTNRRFGVWSEWQERSVGGEAEQRQDSDRRVVAPGDVDGEPDGRGAERRTEAVRGEEHAQEAPEPLDAEERGEHDRAQRHEPTVTDPKYRGKDRKVPEAVAEQPQREARSDQEKAHPITAQRPAPSTRVPSPIPETATARARRRPNQPPTAAMIGTYAQP